MNFKRLPPGSESTRARTDNAGPKPAIAPLARSIRALFDSAAATASKIIEEDGGYIGTTSSEKLPNGKSWAQIHLEYRAKVEKANSSAEARRLMSEMIGLFGRSHYAISGAEGKPKFRGREGGPGRAGEHRRPARLPSSRRTPRSLSPGSSSTVSDEGEVPFF